MKNWSDWRNHPHALRVQGVLILAGLLFLWTQYGKLNFLMTWAGERQSAIDKFKVVDDVSRRMTDLESKVNSSERKVDDALSKAEDAQQRAAALATKLDRVAAAAHLIE